jgi:hypothetical protein
MVQRSQRPPREKEEFMRASGMTVEQLRSLPPTVSVERAAEILGVSRGTAFNMAREFLATGRGLPVLRCGRRLVVLVPRLLQLLGLPDQSEDPEAGGDAA